VVHLVVVVDVLRGEGPSKLVRDELAFEFAFTFGFTFVVLFFWVEDARVLCLLGVEEYSLSTFKASISREVSYSNWKEEPFCKEIHRSSNGMTFPYISWSLTKIFISIILRFIYTALESKSEAEQKQSWCKCMPLTPSQNTYRATSLSP
jgi:hypothetical protein